MKKDKIREHISCILYLIAFFGFLGAVTIENKGSLLDFSDLARAVMCAFSAICVIIAAIVWKAKDERGKKIKYGIMVVAIIAIIGGGIIDYFSTGGGAIEIITLKLPFEVDEVENVEMFHYDGVPVNGEKKVVTEAKDIETLYEKFHLLEMQEKEVEELTGASVTSFRFNLSDGKKYEIIYVGYGVKNGTLKIDNGATYFTMSDIGWNWEFLNKEYETVPVRESELPGYSSMESSLLYGDTTISEELGLTKDDIIINSEIFKEPPELIVVCGEEEITALRGTYSWEYSNGNGTSVGVEADSMHPLECKEYMTELSIAYSYKSSVDSFKAYLQFEVAPDEVEIRYWDESCWNDYSAESEELIVQAIEADYVDGSFSTEYTAKLLEGNYIYEVIAKWSSSEDYGGTAHYSFYTVMGDYEPVSIQE